MSAPVNVLHVADGLSEQGMTASDLCRLLTRWRSRHDREFLGLGVATLRSWDPGVSFLEERGFDVHRLDARDDRSRDPDITARLASIVTETPYHLLHLHDLRSARLGRVAARRTGVPTVVHRHEDEGVQPRDVLAEALLRRQPDAGIAVSSAVREAMAQGWRMPREQIRLIRDGVQLEACRNPDPDIVTSFRSRLRVSEGCALVGTVISEQTAEQVRPLIGAAALLSGERKDLRTALIGSGEHRDSLERYARRLGIADRAIFTGQMRNPAPAIAALGVVVAAAPGADEVSSLMARAMAAGTPLIVTTPDVTEPSPAPERGWMLAPAAPEGLAGAIGRLLDDRELRSELAARAREESPAFGVGRSARELEALYAELIAEAEDPGSGAPGISVGRASGGRARPPAPPLSRRSQESSGDRLRG